MYHWRISFSFNRLSFCLVDDFLCCAKICFVFWLLLIFIALFSLLCISVTLVCYFSIFIFCFLFLLRFVLQLWIFVLWIRLSLCKMSHRFNSPFSSACILSSFTSTYSVLFLFPFYIFIVTNYHLLLNVFIIA